MNEPEFHTMLTTLSVAVQSFRELSLRCGHALAGNRSDGIEVYYILAGTMRLKIPRQSDRLCGEGTLILLPPGLERTIIPAEGVDADCVASELRIAMGVVTARVSGTFELLASASDPIVSALPEPQLIQQMCGLMTRQAAAPGQGSRALVDALMKVCIVMALRDAVARSEGDAGLFGALRDPRLGKAIVAVIENPAAPHTVSSLAFAASMSRSAFAREFAAKLAMTPMAFVARTRLRQGADLLNGTRLPVKMIASNIGFASRSHFSRAFSAAYGADPSSFRRMAASESSFPTYSNAGDRS